MSDCLFCKISAGEIPSNKVYEDDLCYAFYDIAPQAPVHFLVIPKAHIASVSAVTAENSAVVAHIFEVIASLKIKNFCQIKKSLPKQIQRGFYPSAQKSRYTNVKPQPAPLSSARDRILPNENLHTQNLPDF